MGQEKGKKAAKITQVVINVKRETAKASDVQDAKDFPMDVDGVEEVTKGQKKRSRAKWRSGKAKVVAPVADEYIATQMAKVLMKKAGEAKMDVDADPVTPQVPQSGTSTPENVEKDTKVQIAKKNAKDVSEGPNFARGNLNPPVGHELCHSSCNTLLVGLMSAGSNLGTPAPS